MLSAPPFVCSFVLNSIWKAEECLSFHWGEDLAGFPCVLCLLYFIHYVVGAPVRSFKWKEDIEAISYLFLRFFRSFCLASWSCAPWDRVDLASACVPFSVFGFLVNFHIETNSVVPHHVKQRINVTPTRLAILWPTATLFALVRRLSRGPRRFAISSVLVGSSSI